MNQRNEEIRRLYREGNYSIADLSRKFNLSYNRTYQITTGYSSFSSHGFSFNKYHSIITPNCGTKDCQNKPADIHHKDHNSANNNLDNLIYLCKPCHREKHKDRKKNKNPYRPYQEMKRVTVYVDEEHYKNFQDTLILNNNPSVSRWLRNHIKKFLEE